MQRLLQSLATIGMALLATTAIPAMALTLPPILSDGMVIQRGQPVHLWGTTAPGLNVTAELGGRSATAAAGPDGRWRLELPPYEKLAGDLIVRDSRGDQVLVRSVLLGQVWLCGGQSNMAFPLRRSDGRRAAFMPMRGDSRPPLRLFRASGGNHGEPENTWLSGQGQSAAGFSAVCYLTGKAIAQELQEPVGLIDTSVGATQLEAWQPMNGRPLGSSEVPFDPLHRNQPSYAFEAVVRPLTPFALKGLIWYQGEADSHKDPETYANRLAQVMQAWRLAFEQPDLPVVLTQLPGNTNAMSPSGWKTIQQQQKSVPQQLPHSFIAINEDLNYDKLHPNEKMEISRRIFQKIRSFTP